ncbi:ESPR-type extended signal peptide-containing protein, partial [Neisseria dentiae]|uniref:ESPR-type extended signal peptide-containing protein n=1 Tax=Neisseria dentiae TaxID=194197 RepID=UPI00359FF482
MNKNYRSIWNEALGAWVAVSEIETAKGKPVGSSVKAAGGGVARAKLVLRVIPLMLGMVFGLNNYAYASSGATVTTTTTDPTVAETTQAPIIIGTLSTKANVTAGTATLTGTSQSANLYYNENPGNPYRDGLTSGTTLVLNNTSAGGVVIGNGASARNFGGLAIGGYASANQNYGIALGAYSLVGAYGGIAIGAGSLASGHNSLAMQRQAAATGAQSLALGTVSYAKGVGSIALGQSATAEGNMAVAIGSADVVGWPGNDIYRDEDAITGAGTLTRANGLKSVAVGSGSKSTGAQSTAVGQSTQATADAAFAAGSASLASGGASLAIGDRAKAVSAQGIAIGQLAEASNSWDISIGRFAGVNPVVLATEGRNVAIGDGALRYGSNANNNIGLGTDAGAGLNGAGNVVLGTYANATQAIDSAVSAGTTEAQMGVQSVTATLPGSTSTTTIKSISAGNSVAIGSRAIAISSGSVALGQMAKGVGATTVAVGNSSRSLGNNAISMGNTANAGAAGAIAIGQQANYQTTGTVGYKTTGTNSITIGVRSNSATQNAIALGTDAAATAATAVGGKISDHAGDTYDSGLVGTTTGANSIAIGAFSQVKGTNAAAIGQASEAVGQNSFAGGNDSHAIGKSSTALGDGAKALNNSAQAFGYASSASGASSIAMGNTAISSGERSVAIGAGAQATGLQTISIGTGNVVSGDKSGALGDPSYVTGIETYVIGNDNGSADKPIAANYAGAFGNLNRMTAGADNSRAIGNYNHITTDSTYVLGSGINSDPAGNTLGVTVANSVYLGNDSQVAGGAANAAGTLFNTDILNVTGSTTSAGATGTVSSATVNDITYEGFAGQTAVGAVTVGAANSERRIQNVAAGEISETSTDAINGSQLYFVVEKLQDAQTHYYSVNDGGSQGANYDNKGATGANSLAAGVAAQAVALNATAVGHLANAAADNATVLGNEATATAKDTVAVGQSADATADSAVAVGKNAQGAGNFAVSIGLDSKATNDGAVAMGSGAAADNTYTVAIGNDAKALQDGATALGRLAQAEAAKSLALGTESRVTTVGVGGVAAGENALVDSNKGIAIGSGAKAVGQQSSNIAIGESANTDASGAIVIGTRATTTDNQSNTSAIVIGAEATAKSKDAVGIGYQSVVEGASSVALGSRTQTAKAQAVAVGYSASAGGYQSVALGASANTADNAGSSVAIGRGASATVANGVALGSGSVADEVFGQVGTDPLNAAADKANSTWKATTAAVSVGKGTEITRQITSVAAGTDDTDAVNVAQLKAAGFNLATSVSDGQLVDNTDAAADKKVQNGETVTVDAGKNIKITQNANTISVATKDDVSFTTVTVQDAQGNKTVLNANGVTITPTGSKSPVSLTSSGLNNGGNVISNVANGSVAQGSTEAVTGDQLYAIQQQLNNSVGSVNQGLSFTGNSGNFNRKMGENTTIKGSLANDVAASSSNIRTVADSTGNIEIMLANAPTFTGKVTAQGLDAGGQKITNVQKGSDSADAVNVEQLQDALKNVAVATQNVINANSPFSYVNSQGEMLHRSVNPDGSVTFTKSADNTPYTGSDISIAALNAQAPQSTTPTTLGNIEAGTQANDAVNVSQLQNAVTALGGGAAIDSDGTIKAPVYSITGTTGAVATVSSVGDALTALNTEVTKALTFSGDNSNEKVGRKLGEELAVKGGATGNLTDNNIGVTGSTADNSLLIKLAEQINLGEAGSLQTGATTVNNNGVTVQTSGKQAVSLTSDGLNNGNNKIINVADGVASGDAVNKGQLDNVQAIAEVKTKVSEGTGISVSNKGTKEEPDYEVALSSATQASLAKDDNALQIFT